MKPTALNAPLLDLASRLSALKEDHYRQLLALSALIEVLVDKGIVTPDEIRAKAALLDADPTAGPGPAISSERETGSSPA